MFKSRIPSKRLEEHGGKRLNIRFHAFTDAPSLSFLESSLPFRAPSSFVLFHHPRFSPPPLLGRSLNKHLSQSDHVRAFPISLASVETVEWIEVRDRNVWSYVPSRLVLPITRKEVCQRRCYRISIGRRPFTMSDEE